MMRIITVSAHAKLCLCAPVCMSLYTYVRLCMLSVCMSSVCMCTCRYMCRRDSHISLADQEVNTVEPQMNKLWDSPQAGIYYSSVGYTVLELHFEYSRSFCLVCGI